MKEEIVNLASASKQPDFLSRLPILATSSFPKHLISATGQLLKALYQNLTDLPRTK